MNIDALEAVEVVPGITRRRPPAGSGVRTWIIDMAPGTRWPQPDLHTHGETYLVLDGEVIEGDQRHPAGTYIYWQPGTVHQPRTETGVRLYGFNPVEA